MQAGSQQITPSPSGTWNNPLNIRASPSRFRIDVLVLLFFFNQKTACVHPGLKFMSDDRWSGAKNFRGKHQALDCARFFKFLLAEPFDCTSFDCGQNSEHVE